MKSFKITTIILAIIATISFVSSVSAQSTQSNWVEVAVIDVPQDYLITQVVTANNTYKYYLIIDDHKIYVSPTNYNKFTNKEVDLVVVEWYNSTKGTYRYTTRQKTQPKKRLNLEALK